MSNISRRDLICSGLVFSASTLVTRSAWARATTLLSGYPDAASAEALAAVAPREHLLFDFDWKFQFGHSTDPARISDLASGRATLPRPASLSFPRRSLTTRSGAP
jgi:beta-galactosidase